jgi:hypothetical protein
VNVPERFFEPKRFDKSQQDISWEFASGVNGNEPRTQKQIRDQWSIPGGSAFPGSATGYPGGSGLANQQAGFVGSVQPPAEP